MPRTDRGSNSAQRLLELLFCFSEAKPVLTVSELGEATAMPQSTVYRYAALLKSEGLIEETGATGLRLTGRVVELARAARAGAESLIDAATPILEQVTATTGETALLIQRVGDSAVCVARTLSAHPVRLVYEPGESQPLHRGSAARLLFANTLSEQEREQYRARVREREDSSAAETVPDERAVEQLRLHSWAHSFEEVEQGIWGTAALVSDGQRPRGALGVAGPLYRLELSARERITEIVTAAAAKLSDDIVPLAIE